MDKHTNDASAASWYALIVMTIITLFAYVDRTIFSLLAEPIRLKMGFSDLQLGLLQGTGVAIFAALASYPLGWLSDRFDRRAVLAGCIVFWSLAVVGCGLAQDFNQLFVASALVGAGEAGLVPIVYSLIPDLFRGRKRQLANSIFAVAAGAAGGLALTISGLLIAGVESLRSVLPETLSSMDGWRLSFLAAALPGPLMAALIVTVKAAGNAQGSPPKSSATDGQIRGNIALLPYLREHRAAILSFLIGIGVATFGLTSVGAWIAVILMRFYGQSATQVGSAFGPVLVASTGLGFLVSVLGTRYFLPRVGDQFPVRALWVGYALAACNVLLLIAASSAVHIYAAAFVQVTILTCGSMFYPTVLQGLVPARLRGRLVSIQAVTFLLLGAAAAPTVGLLSDHFKDVPKGLLYSAIGVSAPALMLAAVLLRFSEGHFLKTTRAAALAEAAA